MHGGPKALRQDQPGKPARSGRMIVQAAQEHIGGNRAGAENLHGMF